MAKQLIIHTDGGSRGNPGPAGAGVEICDAKGRTCFRAGYFLGKTTNNVAEYTGLVRGLEAATKLGASEVQVFLDSELLVRQMNGQYRVRSERLAPLYEQAQRLCRSLESFEIQYIPRAQNQRADALADQAIVLHQVKSRIMSNE